MFSTRPNTYHSTICSVSHTSAVTLNESHRENSVHTSISAFLQKDSSLRTSSSATSCEHRGI
jgi:hypothetical protein